jgi:TolB-like protein
VLLLAVAAARFSRKPLISHLLNRDAQPVITSIAVLPLDNLSGDPNQQYFADGMTDELITMLAKESTLRIVSRTSVMQYRGASGPLPEIARALNVDGILEGSVARTNDHVHLTLQLIRAETDVHLWANSYDRALNDSVALPNDAAHEIAKRLNSSLPSGSSTRYVDPAAHDAYLHGLYIFYTGSNERAGEYFKKAVEIQPDYALGLTGLAAYYGAGSFEGELDPRDALPKAEDAAAKAIALDDSLPEAHLAMAAAVYAGRWDWKWSEREIRRAIELNPHFAEAWHFYAKMLGPLNRSDEAIAAQKKGTELDPFARPWALAAILYVARQFDSCLVEAKLRSETYPHDPSLHSAKSDCFRAKGMTRQSVEELIAMYKDSGDLRSASAVSRAFNHGGIDAVVRWQIASAQKLTTKQYVSPVYLAQLHAQLGEREPTLSLLEEGFRQHSPLLLWIQRYPEFDFLHSDPQYCSLVQRAALPPLP